MSAADQEMERARQEMKEFGRVLSPAERMLRERRKKIAGHGRIFLDGPGAEILEELQAMYYDCNLIGDKVEVTYANLGAREVVRYLMDLRDNAKKGAA
jgi:hypothetical protein